MAYDAGLAERIRDVLAPVDAISERAMFGGLAFMLRGNMCCGLLDDLLLVRLGHEGFEAALADEHTRPMDFTGKPSRTTIYVEPAGTESDDALAAWVHRGVDYAASLPPKS